MGTPIPAARNHALHFGWSIKKCQKPRWHPPGLLPRRSRVGEGGACGGERGGKRQLPDLTVISIFGSLFGLLLGG